MKHCYKSRIHIEKRNFDAIPNDIDEIQAFSPAFGNLDGEGALPAGFGL